MNRQPQLILSPLYLHSASTVHLPPTARTLFTRKTSLVLPRLNLRSASSFHIPGRSSCIFQANPVLKLTPLKTSVLARHSARLPLKIVDGRRKYFPSVNKCNANKCSTCNHISCKSTIKSSVNGRVFPVSISFDVN